jgi:hypothetical protein
MSSWLSPYWNLPRFSKVIKHLRSRTGAITEPPRLKLNLKMRCRRLRVHRFVYARHGRDGCGVRVPCTSLGTFQRSVYQVSALRREVRDEGNCARVTERGKEACDRVRKRRVCYSPPGRDLVQAARLRTETWYKAGEVRRVSTTSRSRPQTTAQVNHELAQRNLTFLSGETCIGGIRAVVAPASRACPKAGNGAAQAAPGGAGVSRGRSTATRNPIEPGRTER